MLRKKPSRKATGKRKHARAEARHAAVSPLVNTQAVARDRAAAAGNMDTRLDRAVKQSFRNMGED